MKIMKKINDLLNYLKKVDHMKGGMGSMLAESCY